MADYPDVLDHLGKTPREFGSVQVHVEPVSVDDGWGWTTISFQAAFDPLDEQSSFQLISDEPNPRVLRDSQRVPRMLGGAVVRGTVRFKLPDDVATVVLKVVSSVPKGAERCRPAWKLFDTFEIPKESETRTMGSGGINIGGTAVGSLLGAPLGFAVVAFDRGGPGTSLREAVHTKVHQAQQLPDGFTVEVLRDAPRPQPPGGDFAVLWTAGQPLPAPPNVAAVPAPAVTREPPKSGRMECNRCGFGGKYSDYGTDKYCPECGHEWR